MLDGTFALLERSLRIDSRAWSSHLARLGLLLAIYVSLSYTRLTSFLIGAPGLHFFSGIAYLDVFFMTLLGISFFATSITEEKEEDTLGLMLMAGISPLGILAGKSGGRLWQSMLLIAAQYPFVLLAVTMGGVMQSQVWSVTVALVAYLIFLAGFGLLCSTLAPNSKSASTWMVIGLLAYFFIPMLAGYWSFVHANWQMSQGGSTSTTVGWQLVEAISRVSVFTQMSQILTTGFGETALSIQVISNVLMGIFCSALAWLCFGIATRSPSSEVTSRGFVSRYRSYSPFSAGRPWTHPFRWKDFHFVAGGGPAVCFRLFYYGILGLLLFAFDGDSNWFYFFLFLLWVSVVVDAARVISRSLQEEVRGQTLSALMLLPHSINKVVYSKLEGALLNWLPAPVLGIVTLALCPNFNADLDSVLREERVDVILLGMVVLALFSVMVCHLAALISLYARWGAVPLAIGLSIGIYIAVAMLEAVIMIPLGGSMNEYVLLSFMALSFLGICGACHLGVLLRVQSLATR
ncbi:ABC transporter permease [Schlesneria sp. T3-172]|uniref:ABC transporter permease n=1 Tax=Schlesneria sphaerica TaxID=3373610 RepID=UPI0037C9D22E